MPVFTHSVPSGVWTWEGVDSSDVFHCNVLPSCMQRSDGDDAAQYCMVLSCAYAVQNPSHISSTVLVPHATAHSPIEM